MWKHLLLAFDLQIYLPHSYVGQQASLAGGIVATILPGISQCTILGGQDDGVQTDVPLTLHVQVLHLSIHVLPI